MLYMFGGCYFFRPYNFILALITKEICIFFLLAGVLSKTVFYSIASGMNRIVIYFFSVFDVMIQKADMNIMIFCFLLSEWFVLINTCGKQNYGKWASKIIR